MRHPSVDGRFGTAPGMFSHDRIDRRLEAACRTRCPPICPGRGLADFCAGWGYLSAEVAARCPGHCAAIDLYEADHGVAGGGAAAIWPAWREGQKRSSYWHDLLSEPVAKRLRRDRHEPALPSGEGGGASDRSSRLIAVAARALTSRGALFWWPTRAFRTRRPLPRPSRSVRQIADDGAFKVFQPFCVK